MVEEQKDEIKELKQELPNKPMYKLLDWPIPRGVIFVLALVAVALMIYTVILAWNGAYNPCGLCESKFDMQCVSLMAPSFGV